MKTKEERAKNIADRFFTAYPDSINVDEIYSTEHNKRLYNLILQELSELPDFNPYKIDWERLRDCFLTASDGYISSHLHVAVKIYNSTLPEPLKPLPKATPYEFVDLFNESHSPRKILEWLLSHYGTPEPKPSLPTVEELAKEIAGISVPIVADKKLSRVTAEYIIDKYSLPTREDVDKLKQELEDERIKHAACGTAALGYFTGCHEKYLSASLQYVINLRLKYEGLLNHPREWWQRDFEGVKVKTNLGAIKELDGKLYVRLDVGVFTTINNCTPYTPPSAQDIIAEHNLSEEEVKAIREGK